MEKNSTVISTCQSHIFMKMHPPLLFHQANVTNMRCVTETDPSILRIHHKSTEWHKTTYLLLNNLLRGQHSLSIFSWSLKKGKVLPYSLQSVGPGADPSVQAGGKHLIAAYYSFINTERMKE